MDDDIVMCRYCYDVLREQHLAMKFIQVMSYLLCEKSGKNEIDKSEFRKLKHKGP